LRTPNNQPRRAEVSETFPPWIVGVEHLGEMAVRIHFPDVVRDVDLRAVIPDEERRALEEDPALVSQVGTSVVWPNGARLDAAMLALIYQGFGGRKGWPRAAPPVPADAPFPVPPLSSVGAHPADWVQPTSTSLGRLNALQKMMAKLAANAESLRQSWEEEAQSRLAGELSSSERRAVLSDARARAMLLQRHLDLVVSQLTQTAGLDAIAEGDAELRTLVEKAKRWNYLWADGQEAKAAETFDPLTDPGGFREELRARLLGQASGVADGLESGRPS
jgi:hypothetical protein